MNNKEKTRSINILILWILFCLLAILVLINHIRITGKAVIGYEEKYNLLSDVMNDTYNITDLVCDMYYCTNINELNEQLEKYPFSRHMKKKLRADYANGEVCPFIEEFKAKELAYALNYDTGEIHYSFEVVAYQGVQDLDRFSVFITVNSKGVVTYFKGY